MEHLWEIEHPYYCTEDNYYRTGLRGEFKSWAEFLDANFSDRDLNLLFRWDWEAPRSDDGEGPIVWQGDEYYRDCKLNLFWMFQRKGIFCSSTVAVCRADEPVVRKWLEERFAHLVKLWQPVSGERAA